MATSPSQFWQLSVNGAPPQTFAQNFFHSVRRELRHTDLDRLTFVAGGWAIDAAPLMNFGDSPAVTRNGKPFFSGIALPPQLSGRPTEENHAYTVLSPWYDLTQNHGMPVVLLGGDAQPMPHGLGIPPIELRCRPS
jgi:hypothetical protein